MSEADTEKRGGANADGKSDNSNGGYDQLDYQFENDEEETETKHLTQLNVGQYHAINKDKSNPTMSSQVGFNNQDDSSVELVSQARKSPVLGYE